LPALLPVIAYTKVIRQAVASYPLAALLLTRLSVFFLLYIVLKQNVPSDVFSYYFPQGISVQEGSLPYRDFNSSYGFFFSFLNAGLLYLWTTPRVIVLFAILVEAVTFYGWTKMIKEGFRERFILLYIFNPLCLMNVAIAGQNQILIACFLFLLTYLTFKNRSFLSGAVGVLSACVVKFLSLIFLPPFFFAAKNKIAFIFGALVVGGLYYFMGRTLHANVFQPFQLEKQDFTSGNLAYLIGGSFSYVTGKPYGSLFILLDRFFYLVMAAVLIVLWKNKDVLLSLAIIVLTLMLFSKKSYTNYLVIAWIPLLISFLRGSPSKSMIAHLVLFNILCALEPSLWFRLTGQGSLDMVLHQPGVKPFVFLFIEIAMIGIHALLFYVFY
jgi:hypothetical protein